MIYLEALYHLVLSAAPYLLLGLILAGLIKALVPRNIIVSLLGGKGLGSVFKAALFGAPLPLCSCSVLPVVQGLHRQGASKPASVAFLVSTPETGADSIALTVGLMGWPMALARLITALVSAFIAGTIEFFFGTKQPDQPFNPKMQEEITGIWLNLKNGLKYAFQDLMQDIAQNLLIGFLVGALIVCLIPDQFLKEYTGGGILGMLLVLVLSLPLYICATASTPLALSLMLKGMSPGTALVLLSAGPATNFTSLIVLQRIFGLKSVLLYLTTVATCAILGGLCLDFLILGGFVSLSLQTISDPCHQETIPLWFSQICGLFIVGLALFHTLLKLKRKYFPPLVQVNF